MRYSDSIMRFLIVALVVLFSVLSLGSLCVAQQERTTAEAPRVSIATADLLDSTGRRRSLKEFSGRSFVLLMVKGSFCQHCQNQISLFADELKNLKCPVVVVTSTKPSDISSLPKSGFVILANPSHQLFRDLGSYSDQAEHGTFVFDASGEITFSDTGVAPFMNSNVISNAVGRAAVEVEVSVRKTADVLDDYVTWAPAVCEIRIVNGDAAQPDVTLTLTNDPSSAIPDGGNIGFASSLNGGQTATNTELTLTLPQNGEPREFYIAGTKASTLTPVSLAQGGRDAVMDVHVGDASGEVAHSHAVMVRVRKNTNAITKYEFTKYLEAVADLHNVENDYEWFVSMHRKATIHRGSWPDQAHHHSAFLPWHRAFLLQFERKLQEKFPYVAIPYWKQGVNQTFFDVNLAGKTQGLEVVQFQPGSPLNGWSISLTHDSPLATGPMGKLRRQIRNHNFPPSSPGSFFKQSSAFSSLDNYADFGPRYLGSGANNLLGVEFNPHNRGHLWVGPTSVWMENCRESPADPVFWIFHANHDYLWAKWQYEKNRFKTDGTDPAHYWPNTSYTAIGADQTVPLGHHLNDTMWPWDGSSGSGGPGFNDNRPTAANNWGKFPKHSTFWPTADASPRPKDMIDYLGYQNGGLELGCCYDDVPYGSSSPPPIPFAGGNPATLGGPTLAMRIFQEEAMSDNPKIKAMAALSFSPQELAKRNEEVVELIRTEDVLVEQRIQLLNMLFESQTEKATVQAIEILRRPDQTQLLSNTAIDGFVKNMHFSQMSMKTMEEFTAVLAGIAKDSKSNSIRAKAISVLAPLGRTEAKDLLLQFLESPEESVFSRSEIISLLRYYPDQAPRIRGYLTSNNDQVLRAALQSLYKDSESEQRRIQLANSTTVSEEIRITAIQSLIDDQSIEPRKTLLAIATNEQESKKVAEEAWGALWVNVQKSGKKMAVTEKTMLLEQITNSQPTTELAKTIAVKISDFLE